MATKFSTGLVNKLLVQGSFLSIFNGGFLDIYAGVQPNSADDVPGAPRLLTLYSDSNGTGLHFETTALDGVLSKLSSEIWSGIILADGDAGWYRLREAADDGLTQSTQFARWDGEVGLAGTQMILKSLVMTKDEPALVTQALFTFPRFN